LWNHEGSLWCSQQSVASQLNPVHALTSSFFKIHLNIIFYAEVKIDGFRI
jgi:hypothetical protein